LNDKNNLNPEKKNDLVAIDVKNAIKVFKKRKWWFVVTFIIVLILFLLFSSSLYKNSRYGVKSQVTFLLNNSKYLVMISELYPEEYARMWLNLDKKNIPSFLGNIANGIDGDFLLNEVNQSLNLGLSNNELRERISYIINDKKNKLTITAYSDDMETAKKLNEAIINIYIHNTINYFNITYDSLLLNIEKKISEDQLSKNTEEYNSLVSIQKDLVENKDIYINKITVANLPDVVQNFYLRDVLLSILISLFVGIVIVFFVNFIYVKKK